MSLGALTRSRAGLIAAVVGGVLLYVAVAWFLFVSPKRAEAARLDAELVAAEARLAQARVSSGRPTDTQGRVSDIFRLAKAMPASRDQASLLLELDVLARRANVTLATVTLQEPTALAGGSTAIPVAVTVEGTYREITRFLAQMRRLVGLSGGNPRAVGRLLTVQSVELTESKAGGFPRLDAAILLNSHVYDGPIVPPVPVTPPADDEGTDAAATSAAGATP